MIGAATRSNKSCCGKGMLMALRSQLLYYPSMKSVIVGTAGHIDHGKTSLVKALTGIDADRLEEEKRRGITIDLGFAHLELPAPLASASQTGETLRFGFVDVPGHERFVRNMLAGVGGIDLVLLVIAADESIKPQTREHFDICRLLSIRRGITVITKSDAVDADTLDVVKLEVEEFLKGSFLDASPDPGTGASRAPIVAVSSLTGAGLDELKRELARIAAEVPARDASALARLPIDRVFTMKGFGTVVTGTLVSGTIRKEDELEVFPSGKRVRVRGIQVHGSQAEQAIAGQRTALNLAGVTTEDLARGMTLAPPDTFRTAQRIDVSLSLLPSAKPLKDRARVHLHAFTFESVAEVALYREKQLKPGATAYAQLRLAEPALLLPGDRFIVRQFSPVITIGGGVVLDVAPLARAKKEAAPTERARKAAVLPFLDVLSGGNPEAIVRIRIARHSDRGMTLAQITYETGYRRQQVEKLLAEPLREGRVLHFGDFYVHGPAIEGLKIFALSSVEGFHKENPLVPGISKEELREVLRASPEIFSGMLDALLHEKKLALTGDVAHVPGRGVVMKDDEAESKKIIEQAFASAGLQVPALRDVLAGVKIDKTRAQKIVTLMLRDKVLLKISDELVFHQSAIEQLRQQIAALKAKAAPGAAKIDVGKFKELTGVTRKYAIPLLEYLDRERVTKRVGDERIIL
jgi:selenocysteine-specific elongation factor